MKKLLSIVVASFMMISTVFFNGCGKEKEQESADVVLNVYILDAGYKTEWLDGVMTAFAKEEWVTPISRNFLFLNL